MPNLTRPPLAAFCAMAAFGPALTWAQGIATERMIERVVVTGAHEAAAVEVPSPIATVTADDLREQNLVNPEDALRYMPNVTIRKRYIGDRNALIGGRSFSTLQSARGLVFVDGYLLSNFLGRFDAPRWNMVAPEEIERVDVLYGPFSAMYPGNSIGTTVVLTTRKPTDFDVSLRTTAFSERFDEYGIDETFDGHQVSAFLSNRLANGLWFSLAANRQDSTSHPMQYYAVSANEAGNFPAVSGTPVPVTGVRFDTDPQGRRRAVFGASSGAIDHTTQHQAKLRAGYDFDAFTIDAFGAVWDNETSNQNRTFLRDANGTPVWRGAIIADGIAFNVPSSALAPSTRDERHVQWGTTIRSNWSGPINGSLVYSEYEIHDDVSRQADLPDPLAAQGGPGTWALREGTRWQTLEAQSVYEAQAHTVSIGYHRNAYRLRNPVYTTPDWRRPSDAVAQDVFGRTQIQALYVQDEWAFAPQWSLTAGVRYEEWRAFDGGQRAASTSVDYEDRKESAVSPKLSLSYVPSDDWLVRLSYGRGVRFPTVSELYQGTATAASITVNDPNLQPERSDALDLTIEREFDQGRVRASLFQDDIRDSIWAQTNILVTPSVTNVQNVDRVRTRGIETVFTWSPVAAADVRVEGNLAYARARIMENANFPISVGKLWPRVPEWRGSVQAIWQPTPAWTTSLGLRYSGRAYNTLDNSDVNPDTYGGVSRVKTLDARVAYTTTSNVELALGVDNITDERAYQSHPYPARTVFLEVRWSLEDVR